MDFASARPVDRDAIVRAVRILRDGGLVAVPTETVYGLAADADNPEAVRRIFEAKGRPADHPVIVHVAGSAALADWARDVPSTARALTDVFWPGPLTIVLPRSARAHDALTGGQSTIALRSPAHPWARALLTEFGGALAAPSANRFGQLSPTTAEHVRADLGERPSGTVDLVLDGGPCPVGIESTIVDLSGVAPRLLRPGSISRDDLQRVLNRGVEDAGQGAPRVSGRLEKHYAPRTPVELVPVATFDARVRALADRRIATLAPAGAFRMAPGVVLAIESSATAEAYAAALYSDLHRLDAAGAERLLVAEPPSTPEWEAIRDRLLKAAAGGRPD